MVQFHHFFLYLLVPDLYEIVAFDMESVDGIGHWEVFGYIVGLWESVDGAGDVDLQKNIVYDYLYV